MVMPARSISASTIDQRPFQRFIDRALADLAQLGFQQQMQPQRDIGILGGIFGGFGHRHAIKGDLVLALAGHFAESDRAYGTDAARDNSSMPWPCRPAFQHIGHQHRVIDGIEPDAALQKDQRVIFEILPDFQNAPGLPEAASSIASSIGFAHLRNGVISPVQRQAIALRWPQGM